MKLNYIRRKIDNPDNQEVLKAIKLWESKGKAEKSNLYDTDYCYKVDYEDRLGNKMACIITLDEETGLTLIK